MRIWNFALARRRRISILALWTGAILFLGVERLAGPIPAFSQTTGTEAVRMKVETFLKQIFFVTVRIEAVKEDGHVEIGTGCIVNYNLADGGDADFLVTTRHMISGARKGRFFFIKSRGESPLVGEKFDISFDTFEPLWFVHPDPGVDIAVMPLAYILREILKQGGEVFYRSISQEMVPTQEELEALDGIEDVVFIGYPNGILDERNFLPIARRGSTATLLALDYNGKDQFLIDASVFPGSSGSPVFLAGGESERSKMDGTRIRSGSDFLGLLSGVAIREEKGRIEFMPAAEAGGALEGLPVFKVQQVLNLGMVVKSSAVYETLDAFMKYRASFLEQAGTAKPS